jgi:hypothetical protein
MIASARNRVQCEKDGAGDAGLAEVVAGWNSRTRLRGVSSLAWARCAICRHNKGIDTRMSLWDNPRA